MSLIEKKTLAEAVAEKLSNQIATGHYAIGDQLPIEPALMKAFGVGRSSIREAIKILSIQGLLDVQQGLGTFVVNDKPQETLTTQMSRSEIEDVMEIRSLLEGKIAEKAAQNRTEEQLKEIRNWLDKRKKYADDNDVDNCIHADVNFHIAIADACGNPVLTAIYKAASIEVTRSFISSNQDTEAFKNTHPMHETLYRWIEAQRPDKAATTIQSIIGHH